jgi:hypothetical protein
MHGGCPCTSCSGVSSRMVAWVPLMAGLRGPAVNVLLQQARQRALTVAVPGRADVSDSTVCASTTMPGWPARPHLPTARTHAARRETEAKAPRAAAGGRL